MRSFAALHGAAFQHQRAGEADELDDVKLRLLRQGIRRVLERANLVVVDFVDDPLRGNPRDKY